MSKSLIVNNTNVPNDNLSLNVKLLNTEIRLLKPIFYNWTADKSLVDKIFGPDWDNHFLSKDPHRQTSKIIPLDGEESTNYPIRYLVEKGREITFEVRDINSNIQVLGYILSPTRELNLEKLAYDYDSNYVSLDKITIITAQDLYTNDYASNILTITIPDNEYDLLYVTPVVRPLLIYSNIKCFFPSREKYFMSKSDNYYYPPDLGFKPNIHRDNYKPTQEDGIFDNGYEVKYGGYMIKHNDWDVYYFYQEDLPLNSYYNVTEQHTIKMDINFGYRHYEIIYDDFNVPTHPNYVLELDANTPNQRSIEIRKGEAVENTPLKEYYLYIFNGLILKLYDKEGGSDFSDISSLDLKIYIGDSFTRAKELNKSIYGDTVMIYAATETIRAKSDTFNIYLTTANGELKEVFTIPNNNILTIANE